MFHFGGPGSVGLDPGPGPLHHSSSHAVVASHIEELEGPTTRIHSYVLRLWGEKKRGRLATDDSSRPIFLIKKERKKEKKTMSKNHVHRRRPLICFGHVESEVSETTKQSRTSRQLDRQIWSWVERSGLVVYI